MTNYLNAVLAPLTTWANGLFIGAVRTFTPIVVGAVLTKITPALDWLGVKTSQETVVLAVSAAVAGLWYVLARTFENQKKFAWLAMIGGVMLLIPKPPVYGPVVAAASVPGATPVVVDPAPILGE